MISRPHLDPHWMGLTGRITKPFHPDHLLDAYGIPLDPEKTSVFLCGNPDMIREVTGQLLPLGYNAHTTQIPGSLHTEEYW
jgi:ferredoxin/flavodoxin---NADP+ reductase